MAAGFAAWDFPPLLIISSVVVGGMDWWWVDVFFCYGDYDSGSLVQYIEAG